MPSMVGLFWDVQGRKGIQHQQQRWPLTLTKHLKMIGKDFSPTNSLWTSEKPPKKRSMIYKMAFSIS